MTPQRRKKVNVQEILNNPVDSKQPLLRLKKEGLKGYLSYLGYIFSVVFAPLWFMSRICEYAYVASFPLYGFTFANIICVSLGLILTGITIWKSPYNLSRKTKYILLWIFIILITLAFLLNIFAYNFEWDILLILGGCVVLWLFLLFWYMHYFYRKSKDGYRKVWVKVIISSLIPFLLLLYLRDLRSYEEVEIFMGDTLV